MKLANLIGLLGLLSIIVLIIIYVIKPNFQQKFVSSTYVWKLSLKYRKRRIQTNKLMNLLLILCQVLILTACALILARPIVEAADTSVANEKIIVIDASASMRAEYDSETRFERAISAAKAMMAEAFEKDEGRVSIIIAGETAQYLSYTVEVRDEDGNIVEQQNDVRRASSTTLAQINQRLDDILSSLRPNGALVVDALDEYCTYGSGDVDGAMVLAETVLNENSECRIDFYTGTQYTTDLNSVVDVHYDQIRVEGERNVAILGGSAYYNRHYSYNFAVDVAIYGQDADVEITFYVNKPNISISNPEGVSPDGENMYLKYPLPNLVHLDDGVAKTVVFDTWTEFNDENADNDSSYKPDSRTIYSYEYVYVSIQVVGNSQFVDALDIDNSYYFYDGKRPTISVQYYSSLPNPFISAALASWRTAANSIWDVDITEVSPNSTYATTGYDVYVFEHKMPSVMPDDGVVIMLDPAENLPRESGFYVRDIQQIDEKAENGWESRVGFISTGIEHPILKHIVAEDIFVTKRVILAEYADNTYKYDVLMQVTADGGVGSYPSLYIMNESYAKRMIFCLDVNMSNLAVLTDFPLMMLDTFSYFFPQIITDYVYEVGDEATFNSISTEVYCWYPGENEPETYSNPTTTIKLGTVGSYRLMQRKMNSDEINTYFFVKTPADESNILRTDFSLINPFTENKNAANDLDLLIYFAAALVALLFAEWWLQSRNQF